MKSNTATIFALVIVASFIASPPALGGAIGLKGVPQAFDEFSATEQASAGTPTATRGKVIAQKYEHLFGGLFDQGVSGLESMELRLLFRATNVVTFYGARTKDVHRFKLVLDELWKRGEATDHDVMDVYGALLSLRRFDEARELANAYEFDPPEPLPDMTDGLSAADGTPTVYLVSPSGRRLTRTSIDMDHGAKIIVISHPLCHFSRNAMEFIKGAPVLDAVFARNALWVAPVDRNINFDVLQGWNKSHPDSAHVLAHSRNEWPYLDSWSTPTFYFMKDGILIDKVVGWPSDDQGQKLVDAATKAGLFDERERGDPR